MTPKHAYRILGLEVGASMEEVEEAFADLRAVWDPDRLEDDSELQAKARRKRVEIEQAVEVLRREAAGTPDPSRQDLYKAIFAERSARERRPQSRPERREDGRPSLLSDTFSSQRHRPKPPIPLWAVGGGILVLVIVVLLVASSGTEVTHPIVPTPRIPEMKDPITSIPPPASPSPEEVERDTAPSAGAGKDLAGGPAESAREQPPAPRPRPTPPAPPPRAEPSRPAEAARSEPPASSGPRPRLIRSSAETPSVRTTAETGKTPPPESEAAAAAESPHPSEEAPAPAVDPVAEQAFVLLQAKSDPALQLAGGLVDGLAFAEWRLAGRRGEQYLIDLIATTPDGRQLHHVWAVDPAADTVRALSQAARDLESRAP